MSADGLGNVYIAGDTGGSLGAPFAGGFNDAFVSKYDATGTLQWTRQLGTSADDRGFGVSADGLGNAYVSGETFGSLGGPNAGDRDAFISKYDAVGTLVWTRQLGTSVEDRSFSVSADGLGSVYVTGSTDGNLGGPQAGIQDAFVSKYDAAGNLQWSRQLGTSDSEVSWGVSADGLGNVYITGTTFGSLGGPFAGSYDVFVAKYDTAGNLQWTRQLGTSGSDGGNGVSADGLGNVYVSGSTLGSLGGQNAGYVDAFVSKYDADGNLQWTRQIGTNTPGNVTLDVSNGVSADDLGNVYISGATVGSLGGPHAGGYDAFVIKYDATGTLLWTRQVGTSSGEGSDGVSADGLGNVYFAGLTSGSLGGPNVGGVDLFVAKIRDVPEPESCRLSALAGLMLIFRRRDQ